MNQDGHVSPVKSLTSTRVTGHPSLSCGETLLAFAEWRSLGQVLLVLSRKWMGCWGNRITIDSYCGSFPHSLRFAQVRSADEIVKYHESYRKYVPNWYHITL